MLDNINKTNKKLFTLVATSLLSITILPACSSNKAIASGLHNNEVAETNLNNQSQNDSNQVDIDAQKFISDTYLTSYVMDDPIYMDYIDLPTEGIDDEIYIDILPEGINDGIYIDIPIMNPNEAIAEAIQSDLLIL